VAETDTAGMTGPLVAAYFLFAAVLTRALLVRARLAPPTCASCGLPFERQRLGDPVCRCNGED
jgi:hypothetical protein